MLTWRVCHHRQIEEGIAALTIIRDVWQLLLCIYPLIYRLDIANISDRDIFNFCDWYSYRNWTKLSSKWTVGVFDQGYQSQMFGYTKNAWIADKVNKIIFSIFFVNSNLMQYIFAEIEIFSHSTSSFYINLVNVIMYHIYLKSFCLINDLYLNMTSKGFNEIRLNFQNYYHSIYFS